jgi:hypothetical protein
MAENFLPSPVQVSSAMQKATDFYSALFILARHPVAICLPVCMKRYREEE